MAVTVGSHGLFLSFSSEAFATTALCNILAMGLLDVFLANVWRDRRARPVLFVDNLSITVCKNRYFICLHFNENIDFCSF